MCRSLNLFLIKKVVGGREIKDRDFLLIMCCEDRSNISVLQLVKCNEDSAYKEANEDKRNQPSVWPTRHFLLVTINSLMYY